MKNYIFTLECFNKFQFLFQFIVLLFSMDRITTLGNVDVFTNRYTLPIMALCGSDIKRYQAAQVGTTYSNISTITNNN